MSTIGSSRHRAIHLVWYSCISVNYVERYRIGELNLNHFGVPGKATIVARRAVSYLLSIVLGVVNETQQQV